MSAATTKLLVALFQNQICIDSNEYITLVNMNPKIKFVLIQTNITLVIVNLNWQVIAMRPISQAIPLLYRKTVMFNLIIPKEFQTISRLKGNRLPQYFSAIY